MFLTSSVSCGVQRIQHVLVAADVNNTGYLGRAHSREWERPQLSDEEIAFVFFDAGNVVWVTSQNSMWQ